MPGFNLRAGAALALLLMLALVAAGANSADEVSSARPRLPPAKSIDGVLYYQAEARRQGREGRVELEFNIQADGRADRIAVLMADDESLARDARALLQAIHFDVPADWAASPVSSARYRLGMVYCLPPSGQSESFPQHVSTMIITAARLPGTPVRHPVPPGAAGRCAQAH